MAAYDPKRPRPGRSDIEEPAPVEALLEPAPVPVSVPAVDEPEVGGTTVAPVVAPPANRTPAAIGDPVEVDLREASPSGSPARPGSEVPVAPAPEEGTANRAVLIAGLSAAAIVALVLAILLRRRRRTD